MTNNFPLPNEPQEQQNVIQPPTQLNQPQQSMQPPQVTQPQTQSTNQQSQTNSNNYQQRPKYIFYTGSSALGVSYGEKCIFWESAPALEAKRFDWQNNKIITKMGAEEIDNILDCLNAYKTRGIQGFQQMAQFLQPKNQQPGSLTFFHPTKKGTTIINIFIGKNGIPGISISRTENNGNKKQIYFPILPSTLSTFIRVHDVYLNEALKLQTAKKSKQTNGGQ